MLEEVLHQDFFDRDPAVVAKELLGKKLVRKLDEALLEGVIVETEAYYGLCDPASRAYHGLKKYNRFMWGPPGTLFIYNVHKYWMLNIVAHEADCTGAVLIRALEPTRGLDVMKKNRASRRIVDLTSGPGKLSTALQIDSSLGGVPVTSQTREIYVLNHSLDLVVARSHRVGVKKDLKTKLRFYIEGNKFVSKAVPHKLRCPG